MGVRVLHGGTGGQRYDVTVAMMFTRTGTSNADRDQPDQLMFSRAVLTPCTPRTPLPDQPVWCAKRGGLFLDNRNFLAGRSLNVFPSSPTRDFSRLDCQQVRTFCAPLEA